MHVLLFEMLASFFGFGSIHQSLASIHSPFRLHLSLSPPIKLLMQNGQISFLSSTSFLALFSWEIHIKFFFFFPTNTPSPNLAFYVRASSGTVPLHIRSERMWTASVHWTWIQKGPSMGEEPHLITRTNQLSLNLTRTTSDQCSMDQCIDPSIFNVIWLDFFLYR